MFTPKARYRFYGGAQNYLNVASHALASAFGMDREYRETLERQIASKVGVEHAICVPQARFGLYMIFRKMLTPQCPNVVMSPYTIHDVVNMVLCAGGRPVFADIDPLTCNIDPAQIAKLIDDKTGAVLITHLHGLACDVEHIRSLCDSRGVPMVEDAAQAFGARVDGKMLGGFGNAGVFSFGRAKNINAFYGGMIVTSNASLASAIRDELASLPEENNQKLLKRIFHCAMGDLATIPPVYSLVTFNVFRYSAIRGVESVNKIVQTENNPIRKESLPESYRRRLTSMQARLILNQLPDLDDNTRARQDLARIYHDGLTGLPNITLPPWREDGSHIYLQYPVQVQDRWDYVRYMMSHGRDVAIQHMTTAADLELFKDFARDCPMARKTADRVVLLPTYPGYGEDEARANVKVTTAYLRDCEY